MRHWWNAWQTLHDHEMRWNEKEGWDLFTDGMGHGVRHGEERIIKCEIFRIDLKNRNVPFDSGRSNVVIMT